MSESKQHILAKRRRVYLRVILFLIVCTVIGLDLFNWHATASRVHSIAQIKGMNKDEALAFLDENQKNLHIADVTLGYESLDEQYLFINMRAPSIIGNLVSFFFLDESNMWNVSNTLYVKIIDGTVTYISNYY